MFPLVKFCSFRGIETQYGLSPFSRRPILFCIVQTRQQRCQSAGNQRRLLTPITDRWHVCRSHCLSHKQWRNMSRIQREPARKQRLLWLLTRTVLFRGWIHYSGHSRTAPRQAGWKHSSRRTPEILISQCWRVCHRSDGAVELAVDDNMAFCSGRHCEMVFYAPARGHQSQPL